MTEKNALAAILDQQLKSREATPTPTQPDHWQTLKQSGRAVEQTQIQYASAKYLWEIWPSKNMILCQGRLIFGPKKYVWKAVCGFLLILGLPALWFVFVAPFLWETVNPCLPAFSMYFYVATAGAMLVTMLTEPGIIPRKWVFDLVRGEVPEEFSNFDINENSGAKYCPTCDIYRPPRSHHCKECDNCVLVFDHHCPYINTCIGKRNYRWFITFVINLLLLGLCDVSGLCLFLFYDAEEEDHDDRSFVDSDWVILLIVVIIAVAALLMTCMVAVLCFFHFSLCLTGETTKERIKPP